MTVCLCMYVYNSVYGGNRTFERERGENGFVYCMPHTHYVRAHALTQHYTEYSRIRTYEHIIIVRYTYYIHNVPYMYIAYTR